MPHHIFPDPLHKTLILSIGIDIEIGFRPTLCNISGIADMLGAVNVAEELLLLVEMTPTHYACWSLSGILSGYDTTIGLGSNIGRSTNAQSSIFVRWVLKVLGG
jgi:hypothetical protein